MATSGISISTLLNASTATDSDARKRSFRLFSRALKLLFILDICTTFSSIFSHKLLYDVALCSVNIAAWQSCPLPWSFQSGMVVLLLSRIALISIVIHMASLTLERSEHRGSLQSGFHMSNLVFCLLAAEQAFFAANLFNYNTLRDAEWQVYMICALVPLVSLESLVTRSLLFELTRSNGEYLDVHPHPLYHAPDAIYYHKCDICQKTVSHGGCWRCPLCQFDVCKSCMSSGHLPSTVENLLRNDKGIVAEKSVSSWTLFKRVMELTFRHKSLVFFGCVFLVVCSVTSLVLPTLEGRIIDALVHGPEESHNNDVSGGHIKIYVIMMALHGLGTAAYEMCFNMIGTLLTAYVRTTLYEKILAQDVAFFDGTTTGHLQVRLTHKVNRMMDPIKGSLSELLRSILLIIGGTFMCYKSSIKLATLAFVAVGPMIYLWQIYAENSKILNVKVMAAWAEASNHASQAFNQIRTVKSCSSERQESNVYKSLSQNAVEAGLRDVFGRALSTALTNYLEYGTSILILWYGGILVHSPGSNLSIGTLLTFRLYWNMLRGGTQKLQQVVVKFVAASVGAEQVFSLLDNSPVITTDNTGVPVDWSVLGEITLTRVSFSYQMRPDTKVLTNVTTTLPAGSTCAFVGGSGGGKSTVIKLLLRFYDPQEGEILLDDRRYTDLDLYQLRSLFGVVPQETLLFGTTVEKNISYGLPENTFTNEDIVRAAKQAKAHKFISEFDNGYETMVGDGGSRLSGGQRQRVAIARVFLRKPKIVLLDEATSALDEENQRDVQEALEYLMTSSGCTVVVVAHRLSTIRNADKIVVLEQGTIAEEGTHAELMSRNDVYAQLFHSSNGAVPKVVN